MSLTVVRYLDAGQPAWGVLRERRIARIPGIFESTGALLRAMDLQALASLPKGDLLADTVQFLSPITRNQRFICQGANYRQHMIESGMDPDEKRYNMVFTKASSCIVAADADVIKPRRVAFLDYEIELGLVIRNDIGGPVTVTQDNLLDHVAGAVIVNDYSARDIQIPEMQFHKGKSFRSFGPVGPYLCLLEQSDLPLLSNLDLVLTVNGQVRQRDSTCNLVFGPAETLTELSAVHDFSAGDLLSTGTPAGCALSVPSPLKQRLAALLPERKKWELFFKIQGKRTQYLQPGDIVESRIRSPDGQLDLGIQRNRVVDEPSP